MSEIEELDSVSNRIRTLILNGWENLSELMEENWPYLAQEQKHPWIGDWYNKAPWVKAYYGHIGHQLKALELQANFSSLLERLKSPDVTTSYGAQAEINAAWKLKRSRIPFEFVDPSQRGKSFDSSATVDRMEVGIEVSTFAQSQKFKIQMDIFQKIASSLMMCSMKGAAAAGQLHRMLSRTRAMHIIGMIREGLKDALKYDKEIFIEEADAFEFCIVPKSKVATLQKWKQKRNLGESTQLSAPNFNTSTGNRLHSKILRKCKQIPHDMPGVIYLEGVPVYIMDTEPEIMMDFKLADIEEAVYENTNLLFASLNRFTLGWKGSRRIVKKDVRYVRVNRYGLLEDVSMIVSNRYHRYPHLRHKKLINAFST